MMKKIDHVITFNMYSISESSIPEFVTILHFLSELFSISLIRLTFLVRLQKKTSNNLQDTNSSAGNL